MKGNRALETDIHNQLKEHHLHHEWYIASKVLNFIEMGIEKSPKIDIRDIIQGINPLYLHPTHGILKNKLPQSLP